MKNRFWKQSILALTLGMAFTMGVCAEETETEAAAQETEAAAQETEAAEEKPAGELSEDLYDFQIQIGEDVMTFPMSYEEFSTYGWELSDHYTTLEDTLSPSRYGPVNFSKGDDTLSVYMINLAVNDLTLKECLVAGVEIDNYYWNENSPQVKLAKGIERGKATLDDIKAAYGEASDIYEGDLYTKLTYRKEYYSEIELTVYNESGVLEDIDLQNFVAPEGFEAGSASEEVPEDIAAYKAPAELGDDLMAYVVEFDGALYQLPCPVSALLENGWSLDEDSTEESISAHNTGWVYFVKDGSTFHVLAKNTADYATIPENCWVEELSASDNDKEGLLQLAGGIGLGTTEEELLAALDAAGIEYETYDGSSYVSYTIGEDYWNGYTFYVYKDAESTVHNMNEVYEIEVEHEK